jgi:putative SOS response-associated peptidase YedK
MLTIVGGPPRIRDPRSLVPCPSTSSWVRAASGRRNRAKVAVTGPAALCRVAWGTVGRVCGRFVSASPPDEIARYFDAVVPEDALAARWNVAPTDDVYGVVSRDGRRQIEVFHWGLVPLWAKDPGVGSRMINARAESVASRNAFKPALRSRRCLIPADGFYEWREQAGTRTKQPVYIRRADGEPMAFAGLWETWRDPRGGVLRSCTIVTTEANEEIAPLHDRMPVILEERHWDRWLTEHDLDPAMLTPLLVPAAPGVVSLQPVSRLVNSVRNDGPELIAPVDPDSVDDGGHGTVQLSLLDGAAGAPAAATRR